MLNLPYLQPEALFDASPNPYVLLDPQLRIVAANAAYLKVTMRQAGELLGRSMFEAFPSAPDSPHGRQLRQSLARVLAERRVDHLASIRYPIPRPDGGVDERFWSATHTPLPGPDGEVAYILQHTEDVTELVRLRAQTRTPVDTLTAHMMRRAEAATADSAALAEERGFLRQLFEQVPGQVCVLRGPTHVFELVNAAQRQVLGDRPLIGRSVREALPELAGQGYFELLDHVYASGEPYVGHAQVVELRRPGQDAPERRLSNFVLQPIRDAAGQVQGIFAQGQDITEQLQAEQSSIEHAARFQTLAHSMPNQVWTALPDGRLDWCNEQASRFGGALLEGPQGIDWAAIVHPDDTPVAVAAWQQALRSGEPYHVEFRLRRHDGVYRWHLARALPLRDADGRIVQWVGTNTDIEDQKAGAAMLADLNSLLAQRVQERSDELERMQEVLRHSQKMEAIGKLAGGIAHDFNNLLQVVGSSLQMLQRQAALAPPDQVLIARALAGVERGARLTGQLLAFGRRQPLAPEVVQVGRLIEGMHEMLRSSLGEGIEIRTELGQGLWHTQVDPGQVENALLNLALNARDAMHGRGRLLIEAANVEIDAAAAARQPELRAGTYVRVSVGDTGAGMSAEVMQRAFDPFYTTKPLGKGTGLGLSMVYGFVRQSGGEVLLESAPGRGTTVRLYLPRCAAPTPSAAAVDGEAPRGEGETVLVAEDDDGLRAVTVALLQDLGYRVLAARDAEGALAVIDGGAAVDLLFSDVVMPGPMEVSGLAQAARRRRPGLAVLFSSGFAEDRIVQGGPLDADAPLLGKPYTREALARRLRQALAAARARRPRAEPSPPVNRLRVLICDDDALVLDSLAEMVRELNGEAFCAGSVQQAQALWSVARPDLLITDLALPDGDGRALAAWALQRQPALQVAFASGAGSREAAAALPGAVALAKPFDTEDLVALLDRAAAALAGAPGANGPASAGSPASSASPASPLPTHG